MPDGDGRRASAAGGGDSGTGDGVEGSEAVEAEAADEEGLAKGPVGEFPPSSDIVSASPIGRLCGRLLTQYAQ